MSSAITEAMTDSPEVTGAAGRERCPSCGEAAEKISECGECAAKMCARCSASGVLCEVCDEREADGSGGFDPNAGHASRQINNIER